MKLKYFRRGFLILLALCGLYVFVLWGEWLPPVSDAQRADLALMEEDSGRVAGQRDAFPLAMLMPYAIPASEFQAVWAADQARYAELSAANKGLSFVSTAKGKYPESVVDTTDLCKRETVSCLSHVREKRELVTAALAPHAAYLARTHALRSADYMRQPFEPSLASPVPPFRGIGPLQATSSALQFIDGQVDTALDNTCRDLASWRRLRAHTDMLIADMVGVSYGSQLAHLLAEMLGELPPDHSLPASCSEALAAPTADEFNQCDSLRNEYRTLASYITLAMAEERVDEAPRAGLNLTSFFAPLGINETATRARVASHAAATCRYSREFAQGSGSGAAPTLEAPTWQDRMFNPIGSVLWQVATPDYAQYVARARNFEATLQALRTVAWLRGQTLPPAAAFAGRPADMATPRHTLVIDEGQHALRLTLLKPRPNEQADVLLPLPGSRVMAVPTTQAAAPN